MGASHSNLTETNAVLNNELRSKCEEFVGKDESRLWNGVLHLLKNESISFSDAELQSALCLLNLCVNHKDSLKDFESLFLGPKSTNEDEQDCIDVNKANDFEVKQVEKSSTDKSFFEEDRDEIAKDIDSFLEGTNDVDETNKESIFMSKEVSGEFQFIILKSEDETHEEEEKAKSIQKKKRDVRKKNGKLMAPLSSQNPRTCHASPSICLSIQN